MNTEPQYRILTSTREQLPEAIARAYRAVELDPPNQGAHLLAQLNAEPTAEQVALDLAAESVEVTDPAEWTDTALERIQRAQAADALRRAVAGHRSHAMKVNGGNLIRQATSDLAKPFTAQVRRLTKAAAGLPAGEDPLSLEATIETDATAARRETMQALRILAAIASVLGTTPVGELHTTVRDLLYVVDVPEVPLAHVNRLTRDTLNPDDSRDRLRRLADDTERHGTDRALIGVARGDYGPDVTLSLPADTAALRVRLERMRVAVSALAVDEWKAEPPKARKPLVIRT